MEKRITVHNSTAMPIYVGSSMVPAGETRDFPESSVPPHLRPAADEAPAVEDAVTDPVADLQMMGLKDILPALADLSDDDLAQLEAIEQAQDAPRKTLTSAIAEEKLKRASAIGTAASANDTGVAGADVNDAPAAALAPAAGTEG